MNLAIRIYFHCTCLVNNFSQTIFLAESSTLKSKYGSLKPSSSPIENPFQEPTD
ncbi:unnamed protein product, partial [Rotaria sordida]